LFVGNDVHFNHCVFGRSIFPKFYKIYTTLISEV
jgi:hypothetical protein